MKWVQTVRCLFALSCALFLLVPAGAQTVCDGAIGSLSPLIIKGAAKRFASLTLHPLPDPFNCGSLASPTPATCEVFNRMYTTGESLCLNAQRGSPPPDAIPNAYGMDLKFLETDAFNLANWPTTIPRDGADWVILWDHVDFEGTPGYIGYYGAQTDAVILNEQGNHKVNDCLGSSPISCVFHLTGATNTACRPIAATPLGDLGSEGSLMPVPVPLVTGVDLGVSGDFADPLASIDLIWGVISVDPITGATTSVAPCNATTHDGAPNPLMGYRLDVFVDNNGNGVADIPGDSDWVVADRATNGGCNSDSYTALLDIAPTPFDPDAPPDVLGDIDTLGITLNLADSQFDPVLGDRGLIESLVFRLRILYRDDRFTTPTVGGPSGTIDTVCSAPSAQGPRIAIGGCVDNDGDGFGSPEDASCPGGIQEDCDDTDPALNPGAPELCDGVDNNCNGIVDGITELDRDGDSFTTCAGPLQDCDDTNPSVFPGAPQDCDGVNNDCDHPGWPSLTDTNESDDDSDTFTECQGDCDDSDAAVFLGAPELCDGLDNDCNGDIDDGFSDADGDTFNSCLDCDDGDPSTNPGAPELCDGKDNDCDGAIPGNETDQDGDSFRVCEGDCDDSELSVHPGAPEVCDGLDNDCDTTIPSNEADTDIDGLRICEGDCDDVDPTTFPGAPELCDRVDNDCDLIVDEGPPDGDGDIVRDDCDNCPMTANPSQEDQDGDVIGDACDNCLLDPNTDQTDTDLDGMGDVCDICPLNPLNPDGDADGVCEDNDNCPGVSNPTQNDNDGDLLGDACDNCPTAFNPSQADTDGDLLGNSCDNCILTPNPSQSDIDSDQRGDVCDNCPLEANTLQDDTDADGVGDVCDNCIPNPNPSQADSDGDGIGDACEDNDADGFFADVDCNDTDPAINPGQVEDCFTGLDEECNGLADCQDEVVCSADPGRPPNEVTGVLFAADQITLTWNSEPRADVYDILTGDPNSLRIDGGFSSATCQAVRVPETFYSFTEPLAPGDARYFLIRGKGDQCKLGTWGSVLRDEEMRVCP